MYMFNGVAKVGIVELENLESNCWVDLNEIEGVGGLEGLEFIVENITRGNYYAVYKYINEAEFTVALIKIEEEKEEQAFERADRVCAGLYKNEQLTDEMLSWVEYYIGA